MDPTGQFVRHQWGLLLDGGAAVIIVVMAVGRCQLDCLQADGLPMPMRDRTIERSEEEKGEECCHARGEASADSTGVGEGLHCTNNRFAAYCPDGTPVQSYLITLQS